MVASLPVAMRCRLRGIDLWPRSPSWPRLACSPCGTRRRRSWASAPCPATRRPLPKQFASATASTRVGRTAARQPTAGRRCLAGWCCRRQGRRRRRPPGCCRWQASRQRCTDTRGRSPLSTIQMLLTLAGSIVIPVGLVAPDVVIVQLLTSEPPVVYLNTLSVVESLTTHRLTPFGDDVFGTRVAAVQAEAAGRILAAREARRGPQCTCRPCRSWHRRSRYRCRWWQCLPPWHWWPGCRRSRSRAVRRCCCRRTPCDWRRRPRSCRPRSCWPLRAGRCCRC